MRSLRNKNGDSIAQVYHTPLRRCAQVQAYGGTHSRGSMFQGQTVRLCLLLGENRGTCRRAQLHFGHIFTAAHACEQLAARLTFEALKPATVGTMYCGSTFPAYPILV